MASEREIRLCIMEPSLEVVVLELLSVAGLECSGRYLHPTEIPRECRPQTLLILSSSIHSSNEPSYRQMGFLALIEVNEKNVQTVVETIKNLSSKSTSTSKSLANKRLPLVLGILPRVGATMLEELLEQELSTEIYALRNQAMESGPQIFCTEIDDVALTQLFSTIDEIEASTRKIAIAVNKVPRSKLAQRKLKALELELRKVKVELFCPIFFDSQLQILGSPSRETLQAIRPLFDWIIKAN